jgi:hypothetical protein
MTVSAGNDCTRGSSKNSYWYSGKVALVLTVTFNLIVGIGPPGVRFFHTGRRALHLTTATKVM